MAFAHIIASLLAHDHCKTTQTNCNAHMPKNSRFCCAEQIQNLKSKLEIQIKNKRDKKKEESFY